MGDLAGQRDRTAKSRESVQHFTKLQTSWENSLGAEVFWLSFCLKIPISSEQMSVPGFHRCSKPTWPSPPRLT